MKTYKHLKDKPRHELAELVVKLTEENERLQRELEIERNTNAHRPK